MNTSTDIAGEGFSWLLQTSWQAAVLAALVLLVQWLFRKKLSASWRYGLWLLVMARLLMPVSPQSAISVFNLARLAPVKGITARTPPLGSVPLAPLAAEPPSINESKLASNLPLTRPSFEGSNSSERQHANVFPDPNLRFRGASNRHPWLDIVFWIWFVGVCILGSRLIWGNLRFRARLTRHVPISDEEILLLLQECACTLGVRCKVTVIETEEVESPALYGFSRKCLLLPDGIFERLSLDDLRYVFLHELAHLKRHDLEVNWITAVLQIAHWFNPVIWLAFARMRADRELATDALALSRTREGENDSYGETILKVVEGLGSRSAHVGLVGIAENKARLRERLVAIARSGSAKPWRWAAVGIAVILASVGLTTEQQKLPQGESQPGVSTLSQLPNSGANPSSGAATSSGSVKPGSSTALSASDVAVPRDPGTPATTREEAEFSMRVLDFDSGKPLPDVTVAFSCKSYSGEPIQKDVLTGNDGRAKIRYAVNDLKELSYRAQKIDYLSLRGEWSGQELALLQKEFEIKLGQGVEIGGSVVDESGTPIAEAAVSFGDAMHMLLSAGQYATDHAYSWVVEEGAPIAVTDGNGNWKAKCIWPGITWASLRVHHPDFADLTASTDLTSAMEAEGKGVKLSFDDLKQHRTRLKLEKGMTVKGRVVTMAGAAGTGMQVSYAEAAIREVINHQFSGLKTLTTDANGAFQIQHAPKKHLLFWIQTPGYAPSVAELDPVTPESEVELRLEKGLHLDGEVLDEEGNDVSSARISFKDFGIWKGVRWEAVSDNRGRFAWEDAPSEKFQLQIEKEGFITQSKIVQARPGQLVSIRLQRNLHITGKVLDTETRKPIKSFLIEWLDRGRPEDLESGYPVIALPGTNDVYSLDLGRLHSEMWFGGYAHECLFRVRADGYSPAVSRTFSSRNGDVGEVEYDVELKPVAMITGVVVDSEGKPVANAQVALGVPQTGPGFGGLLLGGQPSFQQSPRRPIKFQVSDSQGHFHMNTDAKATEVLAAHDEGFGTAPLDSLSTNVTVKLQRWGRIEGTAWEYDRIVTNQQIWGSRAGFIDGQTFRVELRTNSDAKGTFTFDFVPPGKFNVSRMIPMPGGGGAGGPNQLVEVKSGNTTMVKLGGEGRRVVGRFRIKNPYVPIDWTNDKNDHWVNSVMPQPPANLKNQQDYKIWRAQPEVQHAYEAAKHYPLQFATDGSFRIEEMVPGKYQMHIQLLDPRDPDAFAYSKKIGQFSGTFEVPETTGAESKRELDLGVFEMSLKPQLIKGETAAPEFEATDMEDKKFKLADFRGKYVLLDFWATWCGPCVGEIPYLKQVHEKFKNRKDFTMISLSLDKSLNEPRDFLKKNDLPWVQGYLGEWSKTKVPEEYGVQGIPALFLINPEGKLLETDLEGAAIVAKLQKHLQ